MKPMNALETMDDELMIASPKLWPLWPLLPLKNPKRFSEHGFGDMGVITPDYPHTILHDISPFLTPTSVAELIIKQLSSVDGTVLGVESELYDSVEEMLADGWVVD